MYGLGTAAETEPIGWCSGSLLLSGHCFRGARAVDTAREGSFLLTYMALRRQHMADKDLMEGAAAIW